MRILIASFAALVLAGCSSSPSSSGGDGAAYTSSSRLVTSQTEGPDLGSIEEFGIPRGRCGMVLYTQSGSRAVPIFRSTDDGLALMRVDGAMRSLVLVGRGGETRLNVPSSQYFQSDASEADGLSIAVQTRWGQSFPAGAYVQDGTVTIRAADGWSRVLPVAGIAGCRA